MILAIDTSTARLGIAVFNGTEVLAENCWTSPNRHTVSLAPAVDEMLTNLEIEKKKLKAIAVALGPGSFTSLRVGLSRPFLCQRDLPGPGYPGHRCSDT